MTEPQPEPYTAEDDEELDEHGQPLSRLTPTAREHLAAARAALQTDRRGM